MSANVRLDVGQSIPAGFVLGRLSGGVGPAQLIPIQQLAGQVANSGLVTPAGSSGTSNRINRQVITATGTYHKTAGTTQVRIILLGGGAAGGGAPATSATQQSEGAGGGAAGLADIFASVAAYDGQTVTIGSAGVGGTGIGGNGGNSTFAGLTANGGTGGAVGVTTDVGVAGGPGGTASGGDINLTGRRGWFSSILLNGGDTLSGAGAEAPYGLGTPGAMVQTATTAAGNAATGYGAGGSGAANGASQAAATGGNGAPGICIIDEYGPASGSGGSSGTVTSLSQGTGITLSTNPITTTGTITNAGVTSNVAGTGISVSGATGAVTIGNTGVTSLTGGNNVAVSGSTGAVTLSSNSINPTGADADLVPWAAIEGLRWKYTSTCATTAALPTVTYSNGSSGSGATLTASATGVVAVDGHTLALSDSVLVKNQGSGFQNGIYQVTTAGAVGVALVLTRAPWNDDVVGTSGYTATITAGDVIPVLLGTKNARSIWMQTNTGTGTNSAIIPGTDSLAYSLLTQNALVAGGGGLFSGGFTEVPDVSTFTVDNGATVSNQTLKSGFNSIKIMSGADANGQIRGIYLTSTPATPYHIEALLSGPMGANNFGYMGLYWSDGTKYLRNSIIAQGGPPQTQLIIQSWTNTTTFSANGTTFTPINLGLAWWIRIGDDGTNYTFDFSSDGFNWLQLNTAAKAGSFLGASGFTRVGAFAASQGGNQNVPVSILSWKVTA